MQRRRGRYAAWEDARITEEFARTRLEQLADKIGREPEKVEARAALLFQGPERAGPWTQEEDALLRECVGVGALPHVAVRLRRSTWDVQERLRGLLSEAQRSEPLTHAERQVLKRVYGSRKLDELRVIFGRRGEVIESTAAQMYLAKDKAFVRSIGGSSRMPRWSDEEETLLRKCYAQSSNVELASLLGRSVKSIIAKASSMGLKKGPERLRAMGQENIRLRYRKKTPDVHDRRGA
jgi:hypothetical protein